MISRGTRIHNSIEKYLRGDDTYFEGVPQENRELIQLGLKQIDERVDNIRGIELGMWSDSLGLAGTSDLVADYQGELSIIDWKTELISRKKKSCCLTFYKELHTVGCCMNFTE